MTEYRDRRRFESPDRQSALTIEEGDHGLCRFTVWMWAAAQEGGDEFDHAYWAIDRRSGLYPTATEAEEAARSEVDWFRA